EGQKPRPTREGDQDLAPALVAAETGETACEDAARKKVAKLPLNGHGQAIAGVARPRLLEEGLEVLAEDPMQHGVLWPSGRVGPRRTPAVPLGLGADRIAARLHEARSRARAVPRQEPAFERRSAWSGTR